jgi:hypothetical protein
MRGEKGKKRKNENIPLERVAIVCKGIVGRERHDGMLRRTSCKDGQPGPGTTLDNKLHGRSKWATSETTSNMGDAVKDPWEGAIWFEAHDAITAYNYDVL